MRIQERCACCKAAIKSFRDALSRKEYSISGLCQGCQDDVFADDDYEEGGYPDALDI